MASVQRRGRKEKMEGRERGWGRREGGWTWSITLSCFVLEAIFAFWVTTTIYPTARDWSQIATTEVTKYLVSYHKSYTDFSSPLFLFHGFPQIIFPSWNISTCLVIFIDSISRVAPIYYRACQYPPWKSSLLTVRLTGNSSRMFTHSSNVYRFFFSVSFFF